MKAYQINSPIKHQGRTVTSGLVWLPDDEAQELLQLGCITGPMAAQGESVASTEGAVGGLVGSNVGEIASPAVASVPVPEPPQASPANADSTPVPSSGPAPAESETTPEAASQSAPAQKAAAKKAPVKTGKASK